MTSHIMTHLAILAIAISGCAVGVQDGAIEDLDGDGKADGSGAVEELDDGHIQVRRVSRAD